MTETETGLGKCPFCSKGYLVKELVEPFQSQGYYYCNTCGATAPLRMFREAGS